MTAAGRDTPIRPRMLIVMLFTALVLAGCADDPTPKLAAKPTTTPSTSSSASPTAVNETPAALLGNWFRAGTEMQNTGDTTIFLALTRGCQPCERLAKTVRNVYRAGGYITTAPATVTSIRLIGRRDKQSEFVVGVTTPKTTIQRSATGEIEQLSGARNTYRFSVYATTDGLKVENYVLRSKP